MFRQFFGLVILTLILPISDAAARKVKISGSSTMVPFIEKALAAYPARLKAKISVSDSGTGLRDLIRGKADICLMSREITDEELKEYSDIEFNVTHIARDAVIPVVSYHIFLEQVNALTVKQLIGIYKREIKNWSEVGGPDAKIEVIEQNRTSGTLRTFINSVFQNESHSYRKSSPDHVTNDQIMSMVAASTMAIAALPMAWTSPEVRGIGFQTKRGPLYPIGPTVLANEYPTARYLSVVTNGPRKKRVQAFIEYLMGPEGQKIIKEEKMVPLFR